MLLASIHCGFISNRKSVIDNFNEKINVRQQKERRAIIVIQNLSLFSIFFIQALIEGFRGRYHIIIKRLN
jgi:hypothetical protein